jgi:hypothetical protein
MNLNFLKRTSVFGVTAVMLGAGFYAGGLVSQGRPVQQYATALTGVQFSGPAGSDVPAATLTARATAEADSVISFIESRSGIKLDEVAKAGLRESQIRSLTERAGVDSDQFADELAKALVERIRTASDAEYNDYIAGLLRARKSLMIPIDSSGATPKATIASGRELARLARSVREGKFDPNFASYFAAGQMRQVVSAHLGLIAKTAPSFMASTRDGKMLPPSQRLLLAYMILSGDMGVKPTDTRPLVGNNGKFVDIPFHFFLNPETLKRFAA